MPRRFLFAFLVLFPLVGPMVPAMAADAGPTTFGYVDVAGALAFHPLMAKLAVREGRFELSALGPQGAQDRKSLQLEMEVRRQRLSRRQMEAQKAIDALDQSFQNDLKEIADLQARLNALPPAARTPLLNEYNRKKGIIDRKYWKQRTDLQADLKLANHDLEQLGQENATLHLTTMEETQKAFKLMLDDIYEAIDAVTAHYKVSFVFNSSFSLDRTPGNPAFTPENPMAGFFGQTLEGKAEDVLYKHGKDGQPPLFMTFRYWTGTQRVAFRNCYDPRLDKMFIKGGVNMTPAVVDFVYQKYKIDKAHGEVVQKFLEAEAKNR